MMIVPPRAKHGQSDSKLHHIWLSMRCRCNPARSHLEPRYAGRGIRVCQEWSDFQKFYEWANESGYSSELELDRIDNDGNYEPSNCRWTTHQRNSSNRSTTKLVTAFGETKSLAEWARDKRCSITKSTLGYRIFKKQWPPEKAITSPSTWAA